VKNIDINIVGMFSNGDEINEIMDVAKVFVVEERMINISDDAETNNLVEERRLKPFKKPKIHHDSTFKKLQLLTVRGLN